ncbi:MAG: hypothetical protein LBN98_02890 [Prevotellaceae bacterium]|jgi:hypothetical protein|nr:hypothetical protein [Prevotellaceae bacterium]
MKKIFKIMASVLLVAAFTATTVSCSKEEGDDLIGRWVYSQGNYRFLYEGEWYDAKEEGFDLSSFNRGFRGTYFVFEDNGTVTMGFGGQSGSGKYTVSGDEITIKEGSLSVPMGYRVSGKTLELIWDSTTINFAGVSLDEFYEMGFDDIEMTLTFTKAD